MIHFKKVFSAQTCLMSLLKNGKSLEIFTLDKRRRISTKISYGKHCMCGLVDVWMMLSLHLFFIRLTCKGSCVSNKIMKFVFTISGCRNLYEKFQGNICKVPCRNWSFSNLGEDQATSRWISKYLNTCYVYDSKQSDNS